MLNLSTQNIENFLQATKTDVENIVCKDLEEKVRLLIFRDLFRLNWTYMFQDNLIQVKPPEYYNKEVIQKAMSIKRNEIIKSNKKWIDSRIQIAQNNLANGNDILASKIEPTIEVCETQKQHDLFRIYRYYWSSPYSEYVGRRIKLIIRDAGLQHKPVIGIAALGSPIIHIPERDEWIGWNKDVRTENLNYAMDAYVIGALPPYNYLLGGKLVSYILASKEIREIYIKKYRDKISILSGKNRSKLVGLFTTSLYGKSSQYNRLKYKGEDLFKKIGQTKGFGTLHLTNETFSAMQEYLVSKNILIANRFGSGPSWTMRVINKTGKLLGFDPKFLLKHSFNRDIYFVPYGSKSVEFLNGETKHPLYFDYSKNELVKYWRKRWLTMRKQNVDIIKRVLEFDPQQFEI
ncbi:MAG: DUF4338 domain-containing protein [Bacteroidetes bacterium]|nr:DUF4338 domain-containing protein [Bacteroidota bacterium]